MDWEEFFKPFALYGVIVSLAFGVWLSVRTKHVDAKTTSELAVTSRKDYLIFATGLSLGGLFLALCTYGYMRYNLSIPELYYYIYGFMLVLQIIAAWVPDTKGWKHTVHYFTAWIFSYLILVLAGLLLVDDYSAKSEVTGLILGLGSILLLFMVFIGTYGGRPGGTKKQFLRSQQAYIIAFQILLLLRVYS